MTCADCGADIIVTDTPGSLLETEHDCPAGVWDRGGCGILDEDIWLSGVTVFEAKRLRRSNG